MAGSLRNSYFPVVTGRIADTDLKILWERLSNPLLRTPVDRVEALLLVEHFEEGQFRPVLGPSYREQRGEVIGPVGVIQSADVFAPCRLRISHRSLALWRSAGFVPTGGDLRGS